MDNYTFRLKPGDEDAGHAAIVPHPNDWTYNERLEMR